MKSDFHERESLRCDNRKCELRDFARFVTISTPQFSMEFSISISSLYLPRHHEIFALSSFFAVAKIPNVVVQMVRKTSSIFNDI